MNIIKNSLPEGGFHIVKVSNVRKSYVLGSLEIPTLSDINLKTERGELLENVLLPTFANSRSNIAPTKHARELLEVMELRNRMHHKPGKLSGGQSQRVSIAPHINDPVIFLANEPTGKP